MVPGDVQQSRKILGWSQFRLETESGVSRNKIALHEQGYRQLDEHDTTLVDRALKNGLDRLANESHENE